MNRPPGTPVHGVEPEPLLEIVARLAAELHPNHSTPRVALDSRLDRDLGLDSLARVELFARLERAYGVALPEAVLTGAETPRDLLRALQGAAPSQPIEIAPPLAPPETAAVPAAHQADNLVAVLDWHVQSHPERVHIYLHDESGAEEPISYGALAHGARAVAAGLRERDLKPGETVAIMLPTGRDYFFSFFGVLLAGGVPVPIYPPARLAQIEDHLRRHARILESARCALLITVAEARPLARLLRLQVEGLRAVVTLPELDAARVEALRALPSAEDIALLQYTSGSTGQPKGVILTHANLLANIRAMGAACAAESNDVFVSWMPLYHDMGLIGAWLGSLYYAVPLVAMSPLAFLTRPERWLWAIHRHRATLSGAPNFGYELCLRRIEDKTLEGLDLSSWRLAFNGAEAVSPDTLARFQERFARHGFRPEAMAPVYGLAECAVGLAFPPPGRKPVIDHVAREPFTRDGRALAAKAGDTTALRFVACGQPLPNHEIRIVDELGRELGEREEGRLQFRGPSATSGYYRNPEETGRLFRDGWLDSGDLAYLAGGEIYITGRVKDVIIRAGRNIYPHELEEAVGDIPGIRKGCVAVFGSRAPASATERLVVLAETRATSESAHERLRAEITRVAFDLIGTPPDEVVIAPPHSVLKTSSGKVRRAASRELYESGRIGREQAPWRQFLRLATAGLRPLLRRSRRLALDSLYAAWIWGLFAAIAPLTWTIVALVPRPAWNLRVIRAMARALIRLAGLPLRVEGLERLPPPPYVVVANHASYTDGIVLTAVLPPQYSYVAKREFTGWFIAHRFLAGIGSQFVERFDRRRGIADAQAVAQAARAGRTLVFFPEGTFTRAPGLRPFHLGAFTAAAEAGVPVVPVALRGTRSLLRANQWFPRRSPLSVVIGRPIRPEGPDWSAAIKLRDAARGDILHHCGEPDLAPGPVV